MLVYHLAGRYNPLLDKYRDKVSGWTTEKELWHQVRQAFIAEGPVLLKETGQTEPPFNPVLGLQHRGVHAFRYIEDLREEARLNPTEDGFVLWLKRGLGLPDTFDVNNSSLPTRLRTTLGHELGHTFFFDTSCRPHKPFVSYLNSSERRHSFNEEWWCMDFARAFLIPEFWVAEHMKRTQFPSLELASQIKDQLIVSWDVLLRRFLWDLKFWTACVIFRVDTLRQQLTGLWKTDEFKKWSFNRWLEFEGMRLITQDSERHIDGGETMVEISTSKGERFQLRLLRTSTPNVLMGAICTSFQSTIGSLAARH